MAQMPSTSTVRVTTIGGKILTEISLSQLEEMATATGQSFSNILMQTIWEKHKIPIYTQKLLLGSKPLPSHNCFVEPYLSSADTFSLTLYITPYVKDAAIRAVMRYACLGGHSNQALDALKQPLDPNVLVDSWNYPLHIASLHGHYQIVTMLLEAGAETEALCAKSGRSPLHKASVNGHAEVVRLLLSASAQANRVDWTCLTPLLRAVQYSRIQVVRELLKAQADVNTPNEDGATPLFFAAQEGCEEIVQRLCGARADLNKRVSETGSTPLFVAVRQGHCDVVQCLCDLNADIHLPGGCNAETPLLKAIHQYCKAWPLEGNYDMVRLLIENRADVNSSENSESSLSAICGSGAHYIHRPDDENLANLALMVLEHLADIETCDKAGCTPLFSAAASGKSRLVMLLTALRANINAANNDNVTPIQAAYNPNIRRFLRLAGASEPHSVNSTEKRRKIGDTHLS